MQSTISSGAGDVKADYGGWLALANDSAGLVAKLNLLLAAGQLSAETVATIVAAVATINVVSDTARLNRIYSSILLVMATPEYLALK